MRKRLILVLALALVAGLSFAAYAEVQNIKVSGDIRETGIARDNLALSSNSAVADYGKNVSGLLSQVRLRVDADLTDNVSATVRLINERLWGADKNATNNGGDADIALDLANVTLKEFLYSPLTVVVGRQELRYGNAMVIGAVNTNMISYNHVAGANQYLPKSVDDLSLRKSFDAIKAVLNYDPLVLDFVYARVDQNNVKNDFDTNLTGMNASYSIAKDLLAEAYFWNRSRRAVQTAVGVSPSQGENLKTAGVKLAYTGVKDLALSFEGAYQFGDHLRNSTWYPNELTTYRHDAGAGGTTNLTNQRRSVNAFAIQAIASYAFSGLKYSPMLSASYNYRSGDKYHSLKRVYTGWDPMYEDQLGGTIINKLFYNNFQLGNISASVKPMSDLKLSFDWYIASLNHTYTEQTSSVAGAQPVRLNSVSGDPTFYMNAGKAFLGNEFEAALTYDYTEDVQLMLSGGAFIPGKAFASDNNKTATQVMGSMKVTF
jgi:hypothetical protein